MVKLSSNKFFLPILIVILIIPLFYSLLRPGFFPMQDDLQAFRVQQMVKCLQDVQIPCRWIPDMGYQYGYPQFNYYPPSIFYLGGILNLLGIQIIDAVKILFILGFVLSALAMFVLLQDLLGKWPAFVGAILYSFVPYKAAEVYVRGSLSEFWAYVAFPLIFWSAYKLIHTGKLKYISALALSIGLLLITHNLMSFIFLPVFAVWTLVLVVIEKKWAMLLKLMVGVLLGLGTAAFFTLPVIFESKYVHLETLVGGYFDYRQHFVDLNQLFISNHFGYGSSYLGPNDDLSLSTGQVHWVLGLISLILAIVLFKKFKKIATLVITLSIVELLVLFLMHQKSSFLWERLSILSWLQFPWRFLSDSTFILSLLAAVSIYLVSKLNRKFSIALGIAAIFAVVVLHVTFFQPKTWLNISDQDKFSGTSWEKQLTISIFDYLPIYAKFPPNHKAPDLPEVLEGSAQFLSYKKGSDFQIGKISATNSAVLRLPLFDFPGMKVYLDGSEIAHSHNNCRNEQFCLGLITFNIPSGNHTIKAQLTNTPVRTISNIITILSIMAVAVIFVKDEKVFS